MENLEPREYQLHITGERTPQQWDELLDTLGKLGVTDTVRVDTATDGRESAVDSTDTNQTDIDTSEVIQPTGLVVDKTYFFEKADELGANHKIAGKAWNQLLILYAGKNNRAYFENRSTYRYEDFEHVTLTYDYVPPLEHGAMRLNGITGLHIESVVPLLDMYDRLLDEDRRLVTRGDKTIARERVFGMKVGEKTVDFLQQIIEHSRASSTIE